MENKNTNKVSYQFAAITPFGVLDHPLPDETKSGRGFVNYGTNNDYPNFLWDLYSKVTTLRSLIDGCVDYVSGEGVVKAKASDPKDLKGNEEDDELSSLVRSIALDYYVFGGYCIEVLLDSRGSVSRLNPIPFDRVRCSEDKTKLYYSPDFTKKYGRVKTIEVPAYDHNDPKPRSFYYVSPSRSGVYPTPIWGSAVNAALIESKVNEFHLNAISNGFTSSAIVTFCNGVPEDEQKREIEKNFNEKFSGSENAGRIVIAFSPDKEHSTEIQSLQTEDYGEKYKSCIERAREELFVAFRATSNLFGLQKEGIGFNTQEYADSFALFNRTVIRPVQKRIERDLEEILEEYNITIIPFKIEFDHDGKE